MLVTNQGKPRHLAIQEVVPGMMDKKRGSCMILSYKINGKNNLTHIRFSDVLHIKLIYLLE